MERCETSMMNSPLIGSNAAAAFAKANGFDSFQAMVQTACDALNLHLSTEGLPAPSIIEGLHAFITRRPASDDSGRVEYVPNYLFTFDDPSLAARKAGLIGQVAQLEAEAIEAVAPAAKQRHRFFQQQDIQAAETKRLAGLMMRRGAILLKAPEDRTQSDVTFLAHDLPAVVIAGRSEEDAKIIADQEAREASIAAIRRQAAKIQHDIADLTEETIGSFEIPPLTP